VPEDHPQICSQYIHFGQKFNPQTGSENYKIVNNFSREIPVLMDFPGPYLLLGQNCLMDWDRRPGFAPQNPEGLRKKEGSIMRWNLFCSIDLYAYKELLIELKVLPTFGPNRRTTAITTTATSTRMIAYSTSPCPFSCGANNINDSFLNKNSTPGQDVYRVILSFCFLVYS
jgi:hypothetical protein